MDRNTVAFGWPLIDATFSFTKDPISCVMRQTRPCVSITFTSSSTVENFLALKLPLPAGISTASIGPVTSKTMRDHGLKVDVEAKQYDIPGLIAAIQKYYGA